MSSASSTVTYTSVYTNSEPGRPVAPPSPDYIPVPKEQQTPPVPQQKYECEPMFIQPHDHDYVPEPIYPEYIPLEDEHGIDEDEEDEEEHLAPADSAVVIPTVKLVSLPEGTEPVIPPPSTDTTTTGASINVRLQAIISLPPEAEVERLLAMPTPPPSLLTSLSPPSAGERLKLCETIEFLWTQAAHSKTADQIIESVHWKCFGENVGQLVIGLDKVQLNRTLFYVLLDEMVSDRYMFRSGVLNRVAGYGYD
nr:hypothetical protein [Tanacetum cinerariifolium]